MVKELDGTEMTIVPATVGKITPDATPDEEWSWAVAGTMVISVPSGIDPDQLKFIIDHGSSILTEEFYDWLVKENADTLLPLI